MSAIPSGAIEAIGAVTTPGAGGVFPCKGGLIARTGVGVYTLTLDRALNVLDGIVAVSAFAGDNSATCTTVHTSDTVKTVTARAAGTASDAVTFAVQAIRF